MRIDNEIEKVRHDLMLARFMESVDQEKLSKRLDYLYDQRHELWMEEQDVLAEFEERMKPEAIKPSKWWDKLKMRPAGDTTRKDGQWEDAKP